MVSSRRFTLVLAGWAVALFAALAGFVWSVATPDLGAVRLVAGLLVIGAAFGLWQHVARTNKLIAHFVSALCVAWPDDHLEEVEARVDGTLVWPPRGTAGFGYDPAFLPDDHTRTFGEMTSIEKHGLPPLGLGLSHRARAFVKLAEICLDQR